MHSAKRQRRIDMAFPYIYICIQNIYSESESKYEKYTTQYNTIKIKIK